MKRLLLTLAAMAVPLLSGPAAASATRTLDFGIVPQQSASRMARTWGPFMAEVAARTGHQIRFRTTKDIPAFEACLAVGAYQISYMNPMHYAIFAKESGYRAIAHQANKKLRGVIVARKGAGITDLAQLDGATVAFPSPGAFGASILTRAALTARGIDFGPSYVDSHDSVYRAVASGLMPAGGGVLRTFNAVAPEIREQLEIIYETDAFTPHAFAIHGAVPEDVAASVADAFQAIAAERPELVAGIGMGGLVPADDADWDDVRALDMPRQATGISSRKDKAACPSG